MASVVAWFPGVAPHWNDDASVVTLKESILGIDGLEYVARSQSMVTSHHHQKIHNSGEDFGQMIEVQRIVKVEIIIVFICMLGIILWANQVHLCTVKSSGCDLTLNPLVYCRTFIVLSNKVLCS